MKRPFVFIKTLHKKLSRQLKEACIMLKKIKVLPRYKKEIHQMLPVQMGKKNLNEMRKQSNWGGLGTR